MKFDLVFSNPPYNANVDIKILNEIIDVADEFVVVHPSTWIIDLKERNHIFKKFKSKTRNILNSIELFNGNNIFGIQLEVPCAIIHYKNNISNSKIILENNGESIQIDSIDDITKFGLEWISLVKPFYEKMVLHFQSNEKLWSKRVNNINNFKDDKFYCQLTAIMNGFTKGSSRLSDKFYSLTMKTYDNNIGIRNHSPLRDNLVEPAMPVFEFDTEQEQINFLKYCQTDFVRFCLCIYKNSANMIYGEMELIPWLDFNEEWDDAKLFEKFNVPVELQNYIREFLPDYHGIRK